MNRALYRLPDAIVHMSCALTTQLSGCCIPLFPLVAPDLIYSRAALLHPTRNWLYWLSLFLLVDLAYYWAHRTSHEVNLFWGGHVVHHQSEEYNLSVALRQSSFQVVWTFAFSLPLAVLGFETTD